MQYHAQLQDLTRKPILHTVDETLEMCPDHADIIIAATPIGSGVYRERFNLMKFRHKRQLSVDAATLARFSEAIELAGADETTKAVEVMVEALKDKQGVDQERGETAHHSITVVLGCTELSLLREQALPSTYMY